MADHTSRSVAAPHVTPTLPRRMLGYFRVTHPLPSVMYVVATALLSVVAAAASHRSLDGATLARALIAVGSAQIAVGAFNDYCDRELDAAEGRSDKPLVGGLITPRGAVILGGAASVCMLVAIAPLGPLPLVLGLLIEGLGLAYDFRFKGTPVSALLFAVYFPLFPLLAWTLFGRWQPFLPWLLPFGAALGIAMNVANSLPDLEADLAAGVRGLPHLLGFRRGLFVAWGTPPAVLAAMLLLDVTGVVPLRGPGLFIAAAATLVVYGLSVVLYRRRPVPATLRTTFLLQGFGVIALAGGWIAAAAF